MPMPMKPEELRQLRAWAVETALGKAALKRVDNQGIEIDIVKVIADARKLTNFVRGNP